MTRFSSSLEQPTSNDRLCWGRKSQPVNRQWCVPGRTGGGGGVDLGETNCLNLSRVYFEGNDLLQLNDYHVVNSTLFLPRNKNN